MIQILRKAADFVSKKTRFQPKIGVVLGSGLGGFADKVSNATVIPYAEIPGFATTTVAGHQGQLCIGTLEGPANAGIPIAVLRGRLHFYEGLEMGKVIFPVRLLKLLGVENLILTNASGGLNPAFRPCDIMLIRDHINLIGTNPLIGPNLDEMGPRFPDLSEAWNKSLSDHFLSAAARLDVELRQGVYAGLSGPTYETPAEVRMLRTLGADAVGMSTVAECIAANHAGMKVAGLACITNLAPGFSSQKLSHKEVVENAGKTADKLIHLITETLCTTKNI